jgi:hypothetical protein
MREKMKKRRKKEEKKKWGEGKKEIEMGRRKSRRNGEKGRKKK